LVLEGTEITSLFARLFNGVPATFDNKWVRVMGRGESTDEHTDYYRFEGCAQGMYTCWYALRINMAWHYYIYITIHIEVMRKIT
jgi:hypothetical protein